MLNRSVGLFGAVTYGVGIILGAGIYVLIGPATGLAGNSVWLSFIIGALISSFTGLSYAELSTMFPKAAAEYIYVKRAFKNELLAFLTGWLIVFSGIVSMSAVALGFASYFKAIFTFPIILTALILVVLLSLLNFVGIEKSSTVNIIFTAIEIGGLLLVVILGIGQIGAVNYLQAPSISGIFAAAALMFFAYLGFEDIVNIAEETTNPQKNLPRALILSIILTTVLYVLVALAVVNLADWQILQVSDAPLSYAVSTVLGPNGFSIMSYIALFATANTVLITSIVGSRMIYGMAKDAALPVFLSKIHEKTRTPWIAILTMMIFSMFFIFLGDIELVANITSLGVFITFALVNLSLIWLRYKKPKAKRPFRVPLNIGKFPVIAFFGLMSCLLMITQFDVFVIIFGLILLVLGVIVYRGIKNK
ncbi:MAG: amino acid permease [Candidatus Bathyarchaeota archaeon]|nr:amino acid permease [Candidatus Bathyarchaeota archaeon]